MLSFFQRSAPGAMPVMARRRRAWNSWRRQPGYLGIESARDEAGFGITVSYWESEEAIKDWKQNAEHLEAQRRGVESWCSNYIVRIAKVERAYGMKNKKTDQEKTG